MFDVNQQAVFVTTGSDFPRLEESPRTLIYGPLGAMSYFPNSPFVNTSSSSYNQSITPRLESRILKQTFSSVPVILQSELMPQYRELGEALGELTELDDDSEWKIEPDVYRVACFYAAELMEHAYPAPKVFNHGPKSVVFNWANGTSNLYLTISSDSISALVSTPKQIERRMTFSAKQLASSSVFLPTIQSAYLGEPTVVLNSPASDSL